MAIETSRETVERGIVTPTLPRPTRVRTPHDPTLEEAASANAGNILAPQENAILAFTKKHPFVVVPTAVATVGALVAGAAAIIEASQDNTPGIHESVRKDDVFDDTGIEGRITKNNAVQMTPQEYKDLNIPLIEKDGSVNLPFSIVAKDGTIRDVKLKRGGGGIVGGYRIVDGNRIPVNDTIIYEVPDLQPGDRFVSQINGTIHGGDSSNKKNPDGSVGSGGYVMEGVDKNGNKANLDIIVTVGHRTLMEIPNDVNYYVKTAKGWTTDPNMPKKKVDIGDDMWEFTTTKHHKDFEGQVHIRAGTGVTKDGIYSGGGARINTPATNGKAIVLK